MSKMKCYQFDDPIHGTVRVVEGKHGMTMTNAKPLEGAWLKSDNGISTTYQYLPKANRRQRRSGKV